MGPFRPLEGFRRGGRSLRLEAASTKFPRRPKRAQPGHQGVSFIFFLPSMNTTKVSYLSATIFVNTTQNSNNNPWIPDKKNKKTLAVYQEIQLGDFGQTFSTSILQYIKCEFKYQKEISSIYNGVSLTLCQKKRNAFFSLYSVHNIKIYFFFCVWVILYFRYNYLGFHTVIEIIPL